MVEPKLFGSSTRTAVLVAIGAPETSYPRELARVVDVPLVSVQRIVNDLEREGVVVSTTIGNVRSVRLNPRLYGGEHLKAFLLTYLERFPELKLTLATLRRRPRRSGKAI